ncbi:ABC transporter permease [Terrihabitans soli]|uniref:ABC transporter permease n=1 Tax=Terrihabitans soli TaxID=708113 RepID=A0A6S6QTW5_9HYPH|nr:MlaE family lipid ABC transporter permease subunit [Terrihabitans soli]BCJ90511.1 ABC transporter permease [Terrihabitans soli]
MSMTAQPSDLPQFPGLAGLLSGAGAGNRLLLKATGAWTAPNAAALNAVERMALAEQGELEVLEIDASGIQELDTYGAWLIERLLRRGRELGYEVKLIGLPLRFEALFEKVGTTHKTPASAAKERPVWEETFDWLETMGKNAARDLLQITALFGACGEVLFNAIKRPSSFRFTSLIHHLDRVAWQAVPIVLLITFLIGCIIAQQGFFHFRQFGAEDYVVDLVGVLVLREIGVLLVAIMVAGRSGSAYTAELGSMKMREEIDALSAMGRDPVEVLILPRLLALVIAMPVLTFLGGMAAILGGGLVAVTYAGMSPEVYIGRLEEAVSITHFQVGMIKAPFMALLLGLIACNEGLKTGGSAESLGAHTTTSVVKAIFLVIVLDGLFAIFFSSIGM